MKETNYILAYDNEWKFLKTKNPLEVEALRGGKWNEEESTLEFPFFNEIYLINWDKERITEKETGEEPLIEVSIMILNYLRHSSVKMSEEHKFVTLKEISESGALFYPAFYKSGILPLAKTFGNNVEEIKEVSKSLGGTQSREGDFGAVFQMFPYLELKIIIWEGDDELLPSANILFDTRATELMHVESIIGLGMYLSKEIVKKDKKEEKNDLEPVPIFF
ncbi:MAG: DUF3786 domain-containing protein [Eubacteriaceae bacterium]